MAMHDARGLRADDQPQKPERSNEPLRPYQFRLGEMLLGVAIASVLLALVRLLPHAVEWLDERGWSSLGEGFVGVMIALAILVAVFELFVVAPLMVAVVWLQARTPHAVRQPAQPVASREIAPGQRGRPTQFSVLRCPRAAFDSSSTRRSVRASASRGVRWAACRNRVRPWRRRAARPAPWLA